MPDRFGGLSSEGGQPGEGVTHEHVLAEIRAHLAARDVDPAAVTADAAFGVEIDIESLALITLAQHLEDEYGVEISEQDAARFRTVGDTVDFVVRATAPQALRAGGGEW